MYKVFCVVCGEIAVTTAAHYPVCEKHWREYDEEGRQYLPDDQRPAWRSIQSAVNATRSTLTMDAAMQITGLLRRLELREKIIKEQQITMEANREAIAVLDKLLSGRQRVLDAVPECPEHGECVPYAVAWVERMKSMPFEFFTGDRVMLVGSLSPRKADPQEGGRGTVRAVCDGFVTVEFDDYEGVHDVIASGLRVLL